MQLKKRPPQPSPSITTTTRYCQSATEMSCRENGGGGRMISRRRRRKIATACARVRRR
ncbi:hypothetical protein F2Q69_00011886 [Brassica cretica]|uniref:Uncharacterized protein n=1 Tax=Brassica cretica TaxID=69181 RepID=A0A8S9R9J6_BRACR|nr:hypothetical protein F2Q69_00011886 [Brassica cretica]